MCSSKDTPSWSSSGGVLSRIWDSGESPYSRKPSRPVATRAVEKRAERGNWGRWLRDFKRLTGQQRGNETRFTTLFDLYGLPSDFPELAQHSGDRDTTRRAASLEQAMFRAVDDWRLIPYLQRHELETLVLAGFDELRSLLVEEDDVAGYERLRRELAGLLPEDVNDGRDSAPSKRLEGLIPSYRKADHGVRVAKKIGIDRLKQACPRFCDWLAKLEQLGGLGEPSPRP